jgi:NAD+ diphosphatase
MPDDRAAGFRLRAVPLLSRVGADRADTIRTDIDAARAGWPDAQLLRVDRRNQVLISGARVVLSPAAAAGDTPPPDAVFLGRLDDGRHVWGLRAELEPPEDAEAPVEVLDLRRTGEVFDDVSAQLVATATALLNWHEAAGFSPVNGSPTVPIKAGWSRADPVTGREEFPRIDPAIICLVHDGHDRAVLARQTVWPPRLFSILAGFVEAGESFEACVVREIAEEVGLDVTDVHYLGSQPWPFPRSLMVGFHAVADPEQPFAFNDGEIAEASWFTRAEIRTALDSGDWSSTGDSRLLLPGSISIARTIIESWAALD